MPSSGPDGHRRRPDPPARRRAGPTKRRDMTSAASRPFAARGSSRDIEEGLAFAPKFDDAGSLPAVHRCRQRRRADARAGWTPRRSPSPSRPATPTSTAAHAGGCGRRARRAATSSRSSRCGPTATRTRSGSGSAFRRRRRRMPHRPQGLLLPPGAAANVRSRRPQDAGGRRRPRVRIDLGLRPRPQGRGVIGLDCPGLPHGQRTECGH